MAVIEINAVDSEAFQRGLAFLETVLGGTINLDNGSILGHARERESPFRRQENVASPFRVQLEPLSHEVFAVTVGESAVPEYLAELPSSIENLEAVFV